MARLASPEAGASRGAQPAAAPSQTPAATPGTVSAASSPVNSPDRKSASSPAKPQRMTGAQAVVRSLELCGVEVAFGLPGGCILPAFDPLMDASLRHILVRHEQGGGHAASGYAHATGKVGVTIATSGPGATNLVTPLADANMDSIPVVAITGQVGAAVIGTDAFQEADIVGITMPVTKHSYLVKEPQDIPGAIKEAFHIARTGRPGAVLVDIAKSALQAEFDFVWPRTVNLPGYHPVTKPHNKPIADAARLINSARQPVILAGGGIMRSGAWDGLAQLVDMSGIPVTTTLMARDSIPGSHPHNLGMPGMHGTVAAVAALQKADLIVALGARFDDRVTGVLASFAPQAKVIHADIDPAEIGKNRAVDVPIVGDLREVLADLLPALQAQQEADGKPDLAPWWQLIDYWRQEYPLGYQATSDGLAAPQKVIQRIGQLSGDDTIIVTGVGQHQMWASQFINHGKPRTFINSGGLGTMGYGVPAAMGAKVGQPDKRVWCIDGDGCFQMTNQEIATCVLNNIPIKIAIINNSSLGMVRQWQTLFYQERYSNTDLHTGEGTVRVPDFVKLAEAYGAVGLRCESEADIDDTIRQANEINDRVVVVDFTVSPDAMVWPMVAAGHSNDQIMYNRGIAPIFDRTES